jgi:ribosomal-protein-alanine N-acetyltransferase
MPIFSDPLVGCVTTTAPAEPGEPTIRQAERADLLAIYRIEQEAFPQPWPFAAFEQYLGEPGFLVAADDAVIGYIVADITPTHVDEIGHIKDLAVHEQRRREGVATRLLSQALGILERDVEAVKLEVRESNDSATELYETHGFEYRRTVEDYYSNGENAMVLLRD